MRAVDADALMEASKYEFWQDGSAITPIGEYILGKFRQLIRNMPTVEPEQQIIHCKDCKHQEKFFHEDKRRKEGGYYIFGCELADGYSHVCLDEDFCSEAERKDAE